MKKKRLKTAAAIIAAALLAGCSAVPPEPSAQDLGPSADALLAHAGMPLRWWEGFEDPALDRLLEQVLASNLDLAMAAERIREQRAQRRLAGAALYPTLNAGANAQRASGVEPASWYGLDLAWEIDLFGRLRAQRDAVGAQVQAAVHDYEALRLSLMAEVAVAYLQLRLAQQQAQLAQQTGEVIGRTLQLVEARRRLGMANRLDAERMLAEHESTLAEIPVAQQQIASARYALAYLLATDAAVIDRLLELGPERPRVPRQDAARALLAMPAETLRWRPDVRAAERRMAAAGGELAAERAARYPQLTLGGLGGFDSGVSSPSWSLGMQLLQPLFDFGAIRARIESADARLAQSRLAYESALRAAFRESQTSIHAYGQSMQRQTRLNAAAAAAQTAADLARRQYEAGMVSLLEVLDAQRSAYDIERTLSSATTDVALRWVDIYRTLGAGRELRGAGAS
ncbi:Toluene efflux pump outer membrane protein TtgI [Achromobacter anxifer]|uniref:efflux transporter outer membrane subunit n=1 Tax=Achromobacter anxifer TaxID=1287737 RepID=UPI00155BBBFB|nr:efflux transporter outer membrane subunit [Achromobacter anxifer]CAB5510863.1 Toluene efflux pump outer membrane protein TtgI [Achromobacter anxifer]